MTGKLKPVLCNAMGRKGTFESIVLAKSGLRSNLIASKFLKFSGGACPQTLLAAVAVAWLKASSRLASDA